MKVLLDSHIFAWFVSGSRLCPKTTRDLVSRLDVLVFVSAATVWELATESRLGKWPEAASIVANLDTIMTSLRFEPLPITLEHGRVAGLIPVRLRIRSTGCWRRNYRSRLCRL